MDDEPMMEDMVNEVARRVMPYSEDEKVAANNLLNKRGRFMQELIWFLLGWQCVHFDVRLTILVQKVKFVSI